MGKPIGDDDDNTLEGTKKGDKISGGGGDDDIFGHKGNDLLRGDAGNDVLDGGKGNDVLEGGSGHDVLRGGGGRDTFVFDTFNENNSDHVTDFVSKVDKIELDHVTFALEIGKLSADQFVAGKAALDAEDRFIYDRKSGELYYDADGSGAGEQHLIATFDNHVKLTLKDFIIS